MDSILAILGASVVLAAMIFLLRYIYTYRIRGPFVEIVLFNFLPVYRLAIDNIESIRVVSWAELGVGGATVRAGNRLTKECVLIRKRHGVFRKLAITPKDPADFVARVSSAIAS